MQQPVAKDHADRHQNCADNRAGDQRCVNCGFEIFVPLCAEQLCRQNRATDVATERERNEDQRNFITVSNRSQRIVADEFARDKAVGNVIKLLKDDAAEQGKAKPAQDAFRFSDRQILVHLPLPSDFLPGKVKRNAE